MKKLLAAVLAAVAACGLVYAGQDAVENFTLSRLDGTQFKLEENLGKGYVVLNFWARWCASCEEEVPQLAELMKSPGADKALFVGVNVGDTEAKAAKFVAKTKYPFLVVLDKDKAVTKKYGVLGLPVTIIISKDRKIVFRGSRPPKSFDFSK
jgi:thiol-disulfide isomerase/thioredoxin